MQKIHKLPQQVADMIAAGEVVERPGSVIKELIENALDAGAKSITVEIKNGGLTFMRVTDDGCGMSREDAQTAFLRHATSKISNERGLEAIATLGFRGEALAAISSVSRIELITREKGSFEGTSVLLEAGHIEDVSPAGCPEGTVISVCDLFYNMPARLKFMKKDSAEASNIANIVTRLALSHPSVSFRFIKDGKEEAYTSGSGNAKDCVYELSGREFTLGLIEVESEADGISLHGFITRPEKARGNRSAQTFFVNGRYVRSLTMQAALEQAYKNCIYHGRFPGCVLYLKMKAGMVDVNVHPAKTEVRFLYDRAVFDTVYYAVKAALQEDFAPPELKFEPSEQLTQFGQSEQLVRTELRVQSETLAMQVQAKQEQRSEQTFRPGQEVVLIEEPQEKQETFQDLKIDNYEEPAAKQMVIENFNVSRQPASADEPQYEAVLNNDEIPERLPEYRIIGEAFTGYIIVETDGELALIDKHAAHERLLFDKLKSGKRETMVQTLLEPYVAEMDGEDCMLLMENRDKLNELGFGIEDFGNGSILVRHLPAEVENADISPLLSELCGNIKLSNRAGGLSVEDEMLSSLACKAAIKNGKSSEREELEILVMKVLDGTLRYCPHGRPIMMSLSRNQLEKNFKRK